MAEPEFAVIIPACNEACSLPTVLSELRAFTEPRGIAIAVGVNGSSDSTAEIAKVAGARVAEISERGYGYGCRAAVHLVKNELPSVRAFIFFAGDGANDPDDLGRLIEAYRHGFNFVLGSRIQAASDKAAAGFVRTSQNRVLALVCSALSGFRFTDLGPLRLIERGLFDAMDLHEWTYGWTIEAQIRAVQLGARIMEVPVAERARLAGAQKISGVSALQSFRIGLKILAAGVRTRFGSVRC